jgi:hypothetical protein
VRLLANFILGEGLDATSMVLGTLLGQESQTAVTRRFEFSMRPVGLKGKSIKSIKPRKDQIIIPWRQIGKASWSATYMVALSLSGWSTRVLKRIIAKTLLGLFHWMMPKVLLPLTKKHENMVVVDSFPVLQYVHI